MKKLKTPSLVTIAILTTITVIFWVFFSVYRVFATKPTTSVPAEILEPISPTLDKTILDKIQQGVFISEEQIPQTIITVPSSPPTSSPLPTPTLTPSPTATSSATPTASPEASLTGSEQGT